MFHLILAVLSIALMAATVAAGVVYINPGRPVAELAFNLSKSGLTSLETAFNDYRTATSLVPTLENWSTELTPNYVFMPKAPQNMAWSYGSNGTGRWFCLSGSVSKHQYKGIMRLNQQMSEQQLFITTGASCGATTNSAEVTVFPASISVTYWVLPSI